MNRQGGFLMSQIKRVSSRRFDKMLADSGVDAFNGAQGRILYVLWQQEQISISEVAAKTGLANTTLTSMLDRMEASGLLRRENMPGDRRKTCISLTDKARSLQDIFQRLSDEISDLWYDGFSEDEIVQFEDYLLRILHNLDGGKNHGKDIASVSQHGQ